MHLFAHWEHFYVKLISKYHLKIIPPLLTKPDEKLKSWKGDSSVLVRCYLTFSDRDGMTKTNRKLDNGQKS